MSYLILLKKPESYQFQRYITVIGTRLGFQIVEMRWFSDDTAQIAYWLPCTVECPREKFLGSAIIAAKKWAFAHDIPFYYPGVTY